MALSGSLCALSLIVLFQNETSCAENKAFREKRARGWENSEHADSDGSVSTRPVALCQVKPRRMTKHQNQTGPRSIAQMLGATRARRKGTVARSTGALEAVRGAQYDRVRMA